MVIGLFSSCIIVGVVEEPKTYTLTLRNELPYINKDNTNDIFDWYAKDKGNKNWVVSNTNALVQSEGGFSKLRNIPENYYRIVFTFDDTTDYDNTDTYYITDSFYLNSDREFVVQSSTHYVVTVNSRSAVAETSEDAQQGYEIVDSNGNVYPLKKVTE